MFKTNTLQVKGENVMRITELLRKSSIALQVDVQSKEETIDYLVDLISQSGIIPDKEEYKQGILLRESLGTTAIGDEIAIPHAQLDSIMAPGMAAESLTQAGEEMGYLLKAETNGADGAKNVLTAEEIEQADGIIIAADKNVEMARFDEKPVLVTSVTQGIQKPKELIQKIIDKKVPVYHHEGEKTVETEGEESIGRQLYKALMNGVSHMLPFVIGGGILIALAFLLDDYSIDPSNFGKNTPVAAYLKTIGE